MKGQQLLISWVPELCRVLFSLEIQMIWRHFFFRECLQVRQDRQWRASVEVGALLLLQHLLLLVEAQEQEVLEQAHTLLAEVVKFKKQESKAKSRKHAKPIEAIEAIEEMIVVYNSDGLIPRVIPKIQAKPPSLIGEYCFQHIYPFTERLNKR
jgi:hypothetical protein